VRGTENGERRIDPKRAVKKFERSAADRYYLAEDVRTPAALRVRQ